MLGVIANSVEDFGASQGWDAALVFRVNLVLDELASNIMSHGRAVSPRDPSITIGLYSHDEEVVIEVSDDGAPFDPVNDAPAPPVIGPGTEIAPVGGFGLHLVKSMTHSVSYRYEGGRNRLTIVARRD